MTHEELAKAVQKLQDRQEIRDCIDRYCRGVDRFDRELLLSVYHEDAIDDHGIWIENREGFANQAFTMHDRAQYSTQHIVTNHVCELDGDVAHTETYWMFAGMNKTGAELALSGGRYIDRFEKRNGRWAIAERLCVCDWSGQPGPSSVPKEVRAMLNDGGTPARDRTDPSYRRPLKVRTPA